MFNCFESPVHLSVGNIESVRVNKKGRVKYEIAYLDKKGKEHKAWSNWMQDNGCVAGDGIPVQSVSIPCTLGFCSYIAEVNGIKQQHSTPFIISLILVGAGMGVAGYLIGKDQKK